MKIIRETCNMNGSYPPPQDWKSTILPAGFVSTPDTLDLSVFYEYNGFVILNIDDESNTVISIQPNIDAWNLWNSSRPSEIDICRTSKKKEISDACNNEIISGIDVETSQGTEHFNLSLEDQSNINNLFRIVELGGTEFLYQADPGGCRVYTSEEILNIYIASQTHITTQTTYHNLLKTYVDTLETIEDIESVRYGMELPEPYKSDMTTKLSVAQSQIETIIGRISAS